MKIGVQLYTLRNHLKTLDDFEQTLQRVAEMGFHYIQVSGTCPYEPDWLAEQLKKYNLKCVLTHTPLTQLAADPAKVAADHSIFDCKCVGLGSMPNLFKNETISNEDMVQQFITKIAPIAKTLQEHNKYFMYHNHHFEFTKMKNGDTIFDTLLKNFPADQMGFTLDTYWVQYGGLNPAKLIRRLKGRIPCIHFKDYQVIRYPKASSDIRFAPVGAGNLDWDDIISAAIEADVEYALIEQDDCYDADPFICLEQSLNFLKSKGLLAK